MKNLPLGIQTFKDLIKENYLYIDKTKDIYKLLTHNGKYFFLSRPRRFGKSLLISTLAEIFSGNHELFKGLWIYDKMIPKGSPGEEWKKYPIIRIDFSNMLYTHGSQGFEESFFSTIRSLAEDNKIELKEKNYKDGFKELLKKLSKVEKVVLLIDEYDKPIINFVDDLETAKKNRDILKNFYETIKACDEYIRFAFLTGVSKFSKVSVFSGLNNLTDITLSENFATIIGYTEKQLQFYFEDRIKLLAEKLEKTEQETKDTIKNWYNGYSWNGKDFVYNPYSILLLFEHQSINNYWFQTGTPAFLLKLIKEHQTNIIKFENKAVHSKIFDSYEIENINVESLLFQTGYLTVKEIKNQLSPFREYILNYPNTEVRASFLNHLLMEFSNSQDNDEIMISRLVNTLENKDLDEFFERIKEVFSNIPAIIFMANKEAYYHTIIYLILTLIGVRIAAEVHTNKGRIDAVVETNERIYVFEFKMANSKQAIKQIETKKYYEKYLTSKKEILLVGVSFDIEERNIKEWIVKHEQ